MILYFVILFFRFLKACSWPDMDLLLPKLRTTTKIHVFQMSKRRSQGSGRKRHYDPYERENERIMSLFQEASSEEDNGDLSSGSERPEKSSNDGSQSEEDNEYDAVLESVIEDLFALYLPTLFSITPIPSFRIFKYVRHTYLNHILFF